MKHLPSPLYCTIACAIFFLLLGSCAKDESPAPVPITVSLDKNQYAPYEAVTIRSTGNLFPDTFTALVDGVEVSMGAEENTASFILHDLTNGNHLIEFTINGKQYELPIFVAALPSILSPDEYFNEITASISEKITDLNLQLAALELNSTNPDEFASLQADITTYTNLLNGYIKDYNGLTPEEKLEFAKSVAANKASIETAIASTEAMISANASLRSMQSVEDYEAGVQAASSAFYDGVIKMVDQIPLIVAGAIVAKTPIHPIINAGAILATGILVGRFMVTVSTTITAAVTLVNKSVKPFEHEAQQRVITSEELYTSGVAVSRNIQAKYRSIVDTDGSNANNGSTIKTIADKYNYFKLKYNEFRSLLPEIFRPTYVMTNLKSTYSSTSRAVYNQYISISNVSNPNVTLQKIDEPDGSIKIKAFTTATTEQAFTYKINYTNSNFTPNLTKTVNAKVSGAVSIVGTWKRISEYNETDNTNIIIDSCMANNILTYSSNNTFLWKNYKFFNDVCQLEGEGSGTYSISNQTITYTYDTIEIFTCQIVSLTDTTLQLRQTDNHGTYLTTYTKQ